MKRKVTSNLPRSIKRKLPDLSKPQLLACGIECHVVEQDKLDKASGIDKIGESHEIVRMDHTGWYTDSFQDGTMHGTVYGNGEKYAPDGYGGMDVTDEYYSYLAVVRGEWDSVYIDTDTYADRNDAAYRADQMAKAIAEHDREWDECFQLAYILRCELREATNKVREAIELFRVGVPCQQYIEDWRKAKEARDDVQRKISDERPYGGSRMQDSFLAAWREGWASAS